jgi:hypothetical protein
MQLDIKTNWKKPAIALCAASLGASERIPQCGVLRRPGPATYHCEAPSKGHRRPQARIVRTRTKHGDGGARSGPDARVRRAAVAACLAKIAPAHATAPPSDFDAHRHAQFPGQGLRTGAR